MGNMSFPPRFTYESMEMGRSKKYTNMLYAFACVFATPAASAIMGAQPSPKGRAPTIVAASITWRLGGAKHSEDRCKCISLICTCWFVAYFPIFPLHELLELFNKRFLQPRRGQNIPSKESINSTLGIMSFVRRFSIVLTDPPIGVAPNFVLPR